jgi:hypothetical protein
MQPVNTLLLTLGALTTSAVAGKYPTAAIWSTYSARDCSTGKVDDSSPDGVCKHLPGLGLNTWWLADGCQSESIYISVWNRDCGFLV